MEFHKRLKRLERKAEKEYALLYDCKGQRNKDIHYGEARDIFVEAINLAQRLGLTEDRERLSKRCAHLKETFHRHFNG